MIGFYSVDTVEALYGLMNFRGHIASGEYVSFQGSKTHTAHFPGPQSWMHEGSDQPGGGDVDADKDTDDDDDDNDGYGDGDSSCVASTSESGEDEFIDALDKLDTQDEIDSDYDDHSLARSESEEHPRTAPSADLQLQDHGVSDEGHQHVGEDTDVATGAASESNASKPVLKEVDFLVGASDGICAAEAMNSEDDSDGGACAGDARVQVPRIQLPDADVTAVRRPYRGYAIKLL